MLTQGPVVEEFEEAIAAATGARYAVTCSNGTAALHLACLAAGVGKGHGVITSPITFIASSNCALYVGAAPFFADIDKDTCNIDPLEIEKKVKNNPAIKAVIPVHYAGNPCDMEEISRIARKYGLVVIEDACHALGSGWRGSDGEWNKVGSSTHSDMTVFSFHPVKSITTGEGGAITTNDKKLYERLKLFRSHGVTKDQGAFERRVDSPWYHEMHELGFNYRLSDIQSALGLSQIKKLDSFIKRRTEIAALYGAFLSRHPFIKKPLLNGGSKSAFHLYPVMIPFDEIGADKAVFFGLMSESGVNLQVHYIPVHLQPYYRKTFGFRPGDYPAAEEFYRQEVSLPIYPLLTFEDAAMVMEALISALACAAASPAKARAADAGGDFASL